MAKIILDTNFLLIPAQFKIDIFSELERIYGKPRIFILDRTIDELNNIIKKQKGKNKRAADLALKLVKAKKLSIIKTESNLNTDDLLLKTAKKGSYAVATQDKALKKKLKHHEVPLVVLRQKKYLRTG